MTAGAALDQQIEATLRRDRRLVIASLSLMAGVAWLYLWVDARSMSAMPIRDLTMAGMADMAPTTVPLDLGALGLTLLMWAVMMVGMMLPSAAPTILLYAAMVRKNGERGTVLPAVWIFTSGYLAAWSIFSIAAAVLQVALQRQALVTPMMVSASTELSAATLIFAGIYQWLPAKAACLSRCRNPLEFLLARWRPGTAGAFRMGFENGAFCVGCCWLLMLLLFVTGVMNLLWVVVIAGFVFVEKVLPAPKITSAVAGVTLFAAGFGLLIYG